MVITKTPYRVSLFGGGTDFPQWYKDHPGKVVSFSINKYCYISARFLPPFFDHKYRIVYSKTEVINELEKIEHPAVRESIKKYSNSQGLEIHHFGDLPARSGVGSSSAFAVGIISSLSQLHNKHMSKYELANAAIDLEQNILDENVGSQDQIACTYGGVNEITFGNGEWKRTELIIESIYRQEIENRLILIYTGVSRYSSNISLGLISNFKSKRKLLENNYLLASEAIQLIKSGINLDEIGELLNYSWELKKSLNTLATNAELDEIYDYALSIGAIGGKVLGAGGGGFMLFWVKEGMKKIFSELMGKNSVVIPFRISFEGTQSIFNDSELTW